VLWGWCGAGQGACRWQGFELELWLVAQVLLLCTMEKVLLRTREQVLKVLLSTMGKALLRHSCL